MAWWTSVTFSLSRSVPFVSTCRMRIRLLKPPLMDHRPRGARDACREACPFYRLPVSVLHFPFPSNPLIGPTFWRATLAIGPPRTLWRCCHNVPAGTVDDLQCPPMLPRCQLGLPFLQIKSTDKSYRVILALLRSLARRRHIPRT
jgi:hypothetical protein